MGKRKYSDEQIAEVVALFDAGLSSVQIAVKLTMPVASVQAILRRADRKRRRGARGKYSDEKIAEVVALFDAGLSGPQIAVKLTLPVSSVYTMLRRTDRRRRREARTSHHAKPAVRERIADAYRAGDTLNTIMRRERIGANRLRRILLEQGVKLRGRGSKPSVFTGGPIVGRWRLLAREEDDEIWQHIASGGVARLTDRGDDAGRRRFIELEPGDELTAYETREHALQAIARGFDRE